MPSAPAHLWRCGKWPTSTVSGASGACNQGTAAAGSASDGEQRLGAVRHRDCAASLCERVAHARRRLRRAILARMVDFAMGPNTSRLQRPGKTPAPGRLSMCAADTPVGQQCEPLQEWPCSESGFGSSTMGVRVAGGGGSSVTCVMIRVRGFAPRSLPSASSPAI